MRSPRVILISLVILLLIGAAVFLLWRPRGVAAYGPAVALCPGPDLYGYSCRSGAAYAYIDGRIDSELYEDDGIVTLELPFAFTFYGSTYNQVHASSNGVLQFTPSLPYYDNVCLTGGPAPAMGDMIAPYWDDLDLRFDGYLRYDTVGESPNRIFVVEWKDVPRYGAYEPVTFAVQLFEGSHDIVFLYQSVATTEGNNGSSATIGLQSAQQGLALQYGCNQAVVANASSLLLAHPERPNQVVGFTPQEIQANLRRRPEAELPALKGDLALLLDSLNQQGRPALTQLRRFWLGQAHPRYADWRWADLNGDGRDDLIFWMRPKRQNPVATQLLLLAVNSAGQPSLLHQEQIGSRHLTLPQLDLHTVADVTADNLPDLILHDNDSGQTVVVTAVNGAWQSYFLAETCQGSLIVRASSGKDQVEIIRDGCRQPGRVVTTWDGQGFVERP
jgi:hypothetical protein